MIKIICIHVQETWNDSIGAHPGPSSASEEKSSPHPEISLSDLKMVQSRISMFLKSVLLPMALETRALVIVHGTTQCYLAKALSHVVQEEQERTGHKCPFQVM